MHPCEDIFCSFHCPCSYGVFSIDLVQQKSLWSTRSLEFPCRVLLFTFFVYLVSRRYWNVKALELPLSKCFSMGSFVFLNRLKKREDLIKIIMCRKQNSDQDSRTDLLNDLRSSVCHWLTKHVHLIWFKLVKRSVSLHFTRCNGFIFSVHRGVCTSQCTTCMYSGFFFQRVCFVFLFNYHIRNIPIKGRYTFGNYSKQILTLKLTW